MNVLEARRRLLGDGVCKKTVTGNPAIARGSLARMYPGIEMQGWTEQDSTTGAQLFDASGKEVNSSTFIPFPVAVTDGKYTLSTNANRSSAGNTFVFFSGGNVTSGGDGVYEGKSVTVDSVDGYVTILMRKIEGIDPIKNFEIMLNAGTTAKPYEPYTGGVPSPSPDYPQEIVSAGNYDETSGKYKVEVRLTGANLFDKSTAIKNKYISDITGGMYDRETGDTTASDYVLVEGLSYICVTNTAFARWMAFYDINKDFIFGVNGYGEPIPVPQNAEYARFTIPNSVVDTFVINPGETLLPYELYKPPQTVTLIADRPLTKWDKLEKRNGQWGWVYGGVEVDMSSEVTWNIHKGYEQETSNLFIGVMSGVDKIDPTDAILCNILPYYQATSVDVNGIYPLSNNLFARIVGIKSLEDFQEKIQGGKVLAKLSTETFAPLTTAEQEAMNALHTYRPTTVLSNQQDCEMALTYKTRKSMEVTA